MASKITAILVDDEERARDVLSSLLQRHCPQIQIVDRCDNVLSAVEAIREKRPQVLFLDIEMPMYAGYEIVSFFEEIDFEIIFVTAYDQYAVKAFDISAVDYLLKPIEIERLRKSIDQLEKRLIGPFGAKRYKALRENLKERPLSKIVVSNRGLQQVVNTNDIIAIEAQESYSCVYSLNDKFLMSRNLKHYENTLMHNPNFFRSHKSWLVNLNRMDGYSSKALEISLDRGIVAKLSKYKKLDFEQAILN